MNKKLCKIMTGIMLISSLNINAVIASDQVFSDNFENGISKWTLSKKSGYSIRQGDTKQLMFFDDGFGIRKSIIANAGVGSDFDLSFEISAPEGDEFGTYIFYESESNYYLVKFDIKHKSVKLIKKKNGGLEEELASGRCKLEDGKNMINIILASGNVSVKVNDEDILSYAAEGNGKIGFCGKGSSYKIDNVAVNNLTSGEVDERAGKLTIPSDLSGTIDGTNTKTALLDRISEMPEEVELVEPVEIAGEVEIYVSASGSDSNSGTIDSPFKTLSRAASEVSLINNRTPKPKGIVMYIREGTYQITDTLEFTRAFSGTEENPLIISAYNNEKVSFVTGININEKEFKEVTDSKVIQRLKSESKDKIQTINLQQYVPKGIKNVLDVALYGNGVPMTMSRYPNTSEVQMGNIIRAGQNSGNGTVHVLTIPAGVVYEMYDRTPMKWEDTGDILFNGMFSEVWGIYRSKMKIDKSAGTIETQAQSWSGQAESNPLYTHYYENVLEEIDMPGEWSIDCKNMNLYVYPYDTDTEYNYSFVCSNTDVMSFKNVENVVINGITIDHSGGKGIEFVDSKNCVVQNCEIMNTRDVGVLFTRCLDSGVLDSYIYNAGFNDSNGIEFKVLDGKSDSYSPEQYAEIFQYDTLKNLTPTGNFVQNNFISTPYGTHRAVAVRGTTQAVVSHNTFSNCYRYAMEVIASPESVVEYNEAVTTPIKITDAGTFYVPGPGLPNSVHIRYNYFHDSLGHDAIYFDEGTSDAFAYGNVCADYYWCGLLANGGKNIGSYNNIFIEQKDNPLGQWKYGAIAGHMSIFAAGGGSEHTWLNHVAGSMDSRMLKIAQTGVTTSDRYEQRVPIYKKYVEDGLAAAEERANGGYRGSAELVSRYPGGFYLGNNIFVGKNNVNIPNAADAEKYGQPHIVENNFETENRYDVGFIDADNHNFTLKEDSPVYEVAPDFKNIDVSKSGIVRENGRWSDVPEVQKPEYIMPMNNSVGQVHNSAVQFIWTYQPAADLYELEIATDAEFKDMVGTYTTSLNSYTAPLPESGKKYYWRVKANSRLQSFGTEPKYSDVFAFTTMSDKEAKENIVLNTLSVDKLLGDMNKRYNSIVEDGAPGNYKPGAKAWIKECIDAVEKDLGKVVVQSDVDAVYEKHKVEWLKFQKFGVPRYVYLDADDFTIDNVSALYAGAIKNDGEEVIFDTSAGADVSLKAETGPADVYCFKLKMENFKQWMGITPAYTKDSTPRYWLIWKPEQIELQYNDNNLKEQTFFKIEDLSKYNFDEWLDVEFGTVATENGVWITLKINGDTILDYLDTKTPIYSVGKFTINQNGNNGKIHIKATDTRHDGQPVPSTEAGVPKMEVEYNE